LLMFSSVPMKSLSSGRVNSTGTFSGLPSELTRMRSSCSMGVLRVAMLLLDQAT